MKKAEAISLLNSLQDKQFLSVGEAVTGYQLSLALLNHYQAIYFKEVHEALTHDYFLDISINIDKAEYCDKLISNSKEWKELYYAQKEILIAIMLHKKEYVLQWYKLLDILNEEYVTVEKVEKSELISKSTSELTDLFYESIELSESDKQARKLSLIGSNTDDIKLARETLTYIRDDREDLKSYIINNINRLSNNEDTFNSPNSSDIQVSLNASETETELIVEALDKSLKEGILSEEDYDHKIIEIANNIVHTYPIVAYNLLEKMHSPLAEELDLQVEVTLVLFGVDINKGFEYLKKVEVDCFQRDAIIELLERIGSPYFFKTLLEFLESWDSYYTYKYEVLYSINKKTPIHFEEFYKLSSQIMPYDDLNFDASIHSQYYRDKYEIKNKDGLNIVYVGIGNTGLNTLNNFIDNKPESKSIKTIAIDDRDESLNESYADVKIKLDREYTESLDSMPKLEIVKHFKDIKK